MKINNLIRNSLVIFGILTLSSIYGQQPAMYKLAGFASMGDGTTGGAGGDTITVTTGNALQTALNDKQDNPKPLVIIVQGLINEANSVDLAKIDVKDVNDVTIIGEGEGAEFNGIGIKLRRASNIIIRNLKVHHVVIGEGDCISIEGPADHIWVDHCELYNEYQGADKDYYDGLLDAKADCEYLTYSWNFLHDSWKTSLVGFSESDIFDRKLTMHHNYFLNCNSRLPLFRASTGHFFNNYYKDIASTTINSRINSCVLIENNYFENANNPWVSAYSDVLGGGDPVGNILVNSPFQYFSDTHELPYCSPDIPYDYSEVLHNAEDVPGLVMNFAGVGKLDIGENPVYTLTTSVTGSGSITVEPEKPFYNEDESVTLTAVPDPDWDFNSWDGAITGSENPVTITMDEFKTITALFTTDKFTLEYSASGPGNVEADPDLSMYDPGSTVTLTAVPHEGAYFLEWAGDLTGSENPAEIQVDNNTVITAIFMYEATDVLEVQFEDSYCELTGTIETEHAGYTGSGFIDFENATGSNIRIAVNAAESLVCRFEVRYAHGKTDDRSMKVDVNGTTSIELLDFPTTGAFTAWDTVTFDVNLVPGNNMIDFIALTANGGPNVDKADLISAAASLTPGNCDEEPEVINAPSSLAAVATSKNQVDLTWSDNSDNESGFKVERMKEGGSFSEIADLDVNTVSYSDELLDAATTYTYRVKAYGAAGESSWSSSVSATTDPDVSVGKSLKPSGISVFPNPALSSLVIESGLALQKLSLFGIDGKQVMEYAIEGQNIVTIELHGLSPGIYFYRIEAENGISTGKLIKK